MVMIRASRPLKAAPASSQKPGTFEAIRNDKSPHPWQIFVENTGFDVSLIYRCFESFDVKYHCDTWADVQRYLRER